MYKLAMISCFYLLCTFIHIKGDGNAINQILCNMYECLQSMEKCLKMLRMASFFVLILWQPVSDQKHASFKCFIAPYADSINVWIFKLVILQTKFLANVMWLCVIYGFWWLWTYQMHWTLACWWSTLILVCLELSSEVELNRQVFIGDGSGSSVGQRAV